MIPHETPILANSLWTATALPAPAAPPLRGPAEAEVAIVGGGITGLSAALELARRGVSVIVLEAQRLGWGASGRNGGQLNPGLKHDPDAIEAKFGPQMAARMLRLAGQAPSATMAVIAEQGIACDAVQPGWILPAHDAASLATLEARAAQWARRGVVLQRLTRDEVNGMIGTDVYVGGILDPRGGNLHPLNYTLGLARAAMRAGAVVHAESPVISMTRQGGAHLLRTEQGEVRAARVLLATNAYTDGLAPPLARTLVQVQSVQVATDPLPHSVRQTILPGLQAASDSRRVMVYYKMDAAGRLLIGGRGDYNARVTVKLMANLARVARRMFPQLGDVAFPYAWGGYVAMTADHYPHLVPMGEGVLAATGYNGRGLALAGAMGRVMADWASGTPEAALDFPVTAPRPIPFHILRKPAVWATVQTFRLRDALGI